MKQLSVTEVFLIGAAQALALIPGVSRSGSTISAGLALGLTRESAARFSFFMSMPITAGACALQLRKLHFADLTPEFFLGVITAAASGFFAIDVLLRLIRTRSYGVFAVYRVALSILIVALILLGFRTA